MAPNIPFQPYPRTADNLLDEAALQPHVRQLSTEELRDIVKAALAYANEKSSRELLDVPDGTPEKEVPVIYRKSGVALFNYFLRYCSDPASAAHQCNGRHYRDVAQEQFRNRELQMERMNAGWRYQYIAKDGAIRSRRFQSISDIGTVEADFNATIRYAQADCTLTIYVSVKNRTNTLGGQDWPKAIAALENVARNDRNRAGHYICVFGIAMEKGRRFIKHNKDGMAYSNNTEIWKSGFFWPFFTNMTYEDIVGGVLTVLMETQKPRALDVPIPRELIESFGRCCREASLVDEEGYFNDPFKLASLICGTQEK